MSWRRRLDAALDAPSDGAITVREEGAEADVEVRRVDAIGVRIGRIHLRHATPRDIAEEARRLPGELRTLPEPVQAIEVDPALGGAVLRSPPTIDQDGDHAGDFYQVDVIGERDVEVRKQRVGTDGAREDADWDLTREQLGRLLRELDG